MKNVNAVTKSFWSNEYKQYGTGWFLIQKRWCILTNWLLPQTWRKYTPIRLFCGWENNDIILTSHFHNTNELFLSHDKFTQKDKWNGTVYLYLNLIAVHLMKYACFVNIIISKWIASSTKLFFVEIINKMLKMILKTIK